MILKTLINPEDNKQDRYADTQIPQRKGATGIWAGWGTGPGGNLQGFAGQPSPRGASPDIWSESLKAKLWAATVWA